uniref:CCHC-type domain-containing protein n=1 Tax=Knipowitschia caucasica TaxID=637954 RepID=A0AAV2LR46_KNICA
MASAFGKGEDLNYDENEECFDAYLERLEQFFVANGLKLEDDKAKAVFLTVVGKKNHTLLMDLCAPAKPREKKLEELIDLMRTHFVPKTNVIAERYKFNTRSQQENESICEYMASLRKLAATCKFGTFLEDALRDRFVCGVKTAELRDRLLNVAHTKELTLAAAYDMGLAYEVTKHNAQQWSQKTFKANAIARSNVKKEERGKPCYRCAGHGHGPGECRFKDVECRVCKKKGHIAKACRSQYEERKDKQTKWTKHLDARDPPKDSRRGEGRSNICTGRTRPPEKQPAVLYTSEMETQAASAEPQAAQERVEVKTKPGFVSEYQAGNISDLELFSMKTAGACGEPGLGTARQSSG